MGVSIIHSNASGDLIHLFDWLSAMQDNAVVNSTQFGLNLPIRSLPLGQILAFKRSGFIHLNCIPSINTAYLTVLTHDCVSVCAYSADLS